MSHLHSLKEGQHAPADCGALPADAEAPLDDGAGLRGAVPVP